MTDFSFPRTTGSDIKKNKEQETFLQLEPVNKSEPTHYNSRVKEQDKFTNREPVHIYREEEDNLRFRDTVREPTCSYREDDRKGQGRHTNWKPADTYREGPEKDTDMSNVST